LIYGQITITVNGHFLISKTPSQQKLSVDGLTNVWEFAGPHYNMKNIRKEINKY